MKKIVTVTIVNLFLINNLLAHYKLDQKEVELNLSVYTASVNETDSRPPETFDQSVIDTIKLNSGKIRWIAMSRDLLKEFNPNARYKAGDTVKIRSNKWRFSGKFVIKKTGRVFKKYKFELPNKIYVI